MHAPSTRTLRALISISALALTSAAPLVTASAHADTPQAHARAHHRSHDRDHDGLPNGWEKRHGLNPDRANGKADADHDGLTNRQEYKKGLNPKAGDSDHDGLKDGREVRLGTNPRSADTDHDGLKDGREVQLGTSPKSADSDHDGLKDGDEVTTYKSDPTKGDSDGDGVKDGDEVAKGTDPTAPPTTTPPVDGGGTTTPPGDGGGTTTPPGDGGGTTTPPGDTGGTTTVPAPVIKQAYPLTARPTFAGTGVVGDKVTLTLTPAATAPSNASPSDNTPQLAPVSAPEPVTLPAVTVNESGGWIVSAQDDVPAGDYTVTAVQSDAQGHQSAASDPRNITIDTSVPDAPVITTTGAATSDSTPTVEGTSGEEGAIVTVTATPTASSGQDTGAITLGTSAVGPGDHWSVTPTDDKPLADGAYTITATQTDAAGNESSASEPITLTVDATAPTALTVTTKDGATNDVAPEIAGTGDPGDDITVTYGEGSELTDTVNSLGNWSVAPTSDLAPGEYTFTVTETDAVGNKSETKTVTLTVDTTPPAQPSIDAVPDIASGGDTTPDITGTGTAGDQVVVTLNGVEQDPVDVNEDGSWTFTPTDALQDGSYTVTAVETDAAGNTSDRTAPVSFTVDTSTPPAP